MVPSDHTQHMRKKNFIMSWFSVSLTVPCYHAYVIKFGVSQTAGNNYDVGESFFENSHLYMSLYMSCFTTSALKRASFDKFTLTILDATYDLGPFPQKVQHSKMRMNLFSSCQYYHLYSQIAGHSLSLTRFAVCAYGAAHTYTNTFWSDPISKGKFH